MHKAINHVGFFPLAFTDMILFKNSMETKAKKKKVKEIKALA